ncbi:MAG: SprB repeat-containing protein [Bacteroidetes bacterium]|nr:SprB repeat-containing protein [Bacteroidota bacterium]
MYRTGGATDNHWIDNLVINAYNQYEYSIDGTTWTTNPSFTGLATGTYTPRIRNRAFTAYPVSLTAVTISQPANPTATVGVSNVTCNGSSNGVVSANATGAATPYTYLWSTGGTTAVLTGRAAGTYNVTVTSATGCTASATGTVTQPAAIGLSASITNASCLGVCDGAVNLTVSSGTPSAKQPNAPDVAANLVLWANGDNGVLRDAAAGVAQWSDLSTSGNHITQAAAGNRPSF